LGALLGLGTILGVLEASPETRPFIAAGLGGFAILMASRRPQAGALLRDVAILAFLGWIARGGLEAWHAPALWIDALHLATEGGAAAIALYLSAAIARAVQGPALPHRAALFLLGLPLFLKALFLLTSPVLLHSLAATLTFGLVTDPDLLKWIGRSMTLFVVAEAIVSGIGVALDGRLSRESRLHGLLLGAAILTGASPEIADWGSSETLAATMMPLRQLGVILATVAAQAALWSFTYLITGAILDALRGQRPSAMTSLPQWRDGLLKGGIYAGAFMIILQGIAIWRASPLWQHAAEVVPVLAFAIAGALAFPLAKTVVESFDGSAPFLFRLRIAYREPWNFARGVVIGLALGLLAGGMLPFSTGWDRLFFGLATGAAAYAGIDLLRDGAAIALRMRRHLQSPRVYLLGTLLGGIVGGAIASYLDATQIAVVSEKFQRYIAIYFPPAGFKIEPYVIFPLFSKWGATDLGLVTGGVRLFFNESLSGVINWSFAAPLFSINLVLLTALVTRDRAPIDRLVTRGGLVDLVEQAFRVQRWGLWMAPVIYSFLRLAPEPSWYNQDGAIRSIVATLMSFRLDGPGFHDWSLTLFMGLLAYDWLRVVIWFDHMGLRVASLVNASFVVGDLLDEKAARWLGHGTRTRIIPEGIRRFATWAPLLIPFYIPRGSEWDKVWAGASSLAANSGPLLPPVRTLLTAYLIGGALLALALVAAVFIWRRRDKGQPVLAAKPRHISNGMLALELTEEGFARLEAASALRPGAVLDLTRRPVAPSDGRGLFFALREEGRLVSTLTDPRVLTRATPTALEFTTVADGLSLKTEVTIRQSAPIALWTIRIENTSGAPRRLSLASLREIALADWDSYERHPSYQALFIATSFVPQLGALIAQSRKLKTDSRREVFFHAVRWDPAAKVVLTGYQDSRALILGSGTSGAPQTVLQRPDDAGTAFSFDPAACLALTVMLGPQEHVEIRIADGYATSAPDAAQLIARMLGCDPISRETLAETLGRIRPTRDRQASSEAPQFDKAGTALTLGWDTPRPLSHVLGNRFGHGTVIGNDGSVFSFARNSQQNGLTPFVVDTVPAQRLGQAVYVTDLETGELDSPGFVPLRRLDATHRVQFARGEAVLGMMRGTLALEHRIVLPPDAPVELRLITLRNSDTQAKRYRVSAYFEIVLAELPHDSQRDLTVLPDPASSALFFQNPKNSFATGTAFVATSLTNPERETWRARFIGGGDLVTPDFARASVPQDLVFSDKGRVAAFAGVVDVPAGGKVQIAMVLGQTDTVEEAKALIERYASPMHVLRDAEETENFWHDLSSVLRIETSDPAFDRLVNDWLPYQIVAARLWARLGPNQRSGGFGFRDQLQDVLPLCLIRPELARTQILLHASQQFLAGDVLQWWHSDNEGRTGLGARNRASDPHLWLPYLAAQYIAVTGDAAILDEEVRYLEGMPIPPGQEGIAFAPRPSRDTAPLFDHCRRAIERTLKAMGAHGLPLMGAGDWNDGLSAVGAEGKGESVWLGFFLYDVLMRFAPLCEARGETEAASQYRGRAGALAAALEPMWREQGYVRAINDGGQELIFADALMASWPILSGAVSSGRGQKALEIARKALERDGLVLLLDPAFSPTSKPKGGRIADYPPGVRENGGQYSHGVSWLVDAHAQLADRLDAEGDAAGAAALRAEAARLWIKISPLGRTQDGLPPHQQPADVYFGPGYEGRGGWSWYTGAAARMLWGAYALLGIRMEKGVFSLAPHAFAAKGPITLKRLVYKGRVYAP
jgi:cyclic beta-1,2-glucan synthetase